MQMKKLIIYGAIAYLVYDLFLKSDKKDIKTDNKHYTIVEENVDIPKLKTGNNEYEEKIKNSDIRNEIIHNGVVVYGKE